MRRTEETFIFVQASIISQRRWGWIRGEGHTGTEVVAEWGPTERVLNGNKGKEGEKVRKTEERKRETVLKKNKMQLIRQLTIRLTPAPEK